MYLTHVKIFLLQLTGLLTALIPVRVCAIPITQALFSSELEAVQAATNLYNPISIREDREYMGAIYRSGDYYGFTVVAGDIGANKISFKIPAEQWSSVVALWHTHGDASPLKQYFSRTDTRLVKQLRKPLYLADYTGTLKVFRPEDRPLSGFAAQRYGLPGRRGYALGEVVRDARARKVAVRTRPQSGVMPVF